MSIGIGFSIFHLKSHFILFDLFRTERNITNFAENISHSLLESAHALQMAPTPFVSTLVLTKKIANTH